MPTGAYTIRRQEPHVHCLNHACIQSDHSWGSKEVKDWDFVRDTDGNIVVDESHPDWWQDKKNRTVMESIVRYLMKTNYRKSGQRSRKQWKRVLTDATKLEQSKIVSYGKQIDKDV